MKYLALIILFSHSYNVQPSTVYCILKTESSYVHVTGDGGFALGFGQLHTAAIKDACKYQNLDCRNMKTIKHRIQHDKKFAIQLSIAYYKTLLQTFDGNDTLAIMAYQAGPGAVQNKKFNWTYYAKVRSCENDLVTMSSRE